MTGLDFASLAVEEPSQVWDPTVAARGLYLRLWSCRQHLGLGQGCLGTWSANELGFLLCARPLQSSPQL